MAQLVCIEGMKIGLTLNVEEGQNSLGRGGDNELVLPHPSISRKHALIQVDEGKIQVTDLESKNGTFINNNRLTKTDTVKSGDTIKFGEVSFILKTEISEEPPKSRSEQHLEVKLICQEGLEKGFEFIFNSNIMTLGRERMNNIPILHRSISRRHCKFTVQGGRVRVEDLNSLNGTIVNGQKVADAYLRDRDLIVIGDLKFVVSIKTRLSEPRPVSPVVSTPPQIQIQRDFDGAEDHDNIDVDAIDGSLLLDRKVVPRSGFKAMDVSEAPTTDLPEKEFLDTTLTLELERQKLFLLFKISLELAEINKIHAPGADFEKYCQQLFGSSLFLIYSYHQLNSSLEPVARMGNLNSEQFGPFLKELFKTKHNPIILYTTDKLPSLVRLRPDLEGKSIYMSPLLASDSQRIGYILFVSPKDFKETDLYFFRLFHDLISKKFETILVTGLK